jgi:hypothetical protein
LNLNNYLTICCRNDKGITIFELLLVWKESPVLWRRVSSVPIVIAIGQNDDQRFWEPKIHAANA